MKRSAWLGFSIALGCGLGQYARPQPADMPVREQLAEIPVKDSSGETVRLRARICLPADSAPATLVLINHGSGQNDADRLKMQLGRCDHEAAQWFLRRGFVVAFVLRRGFGQSGGPWAEAPGPCNTPDFRRAGLATAEDLDATIKALSSLPFVKASGAVVVGQSAGGWGTIAYDSIAHPNVAAFVVMAGGRGGHRNHRAHENCRPDLLAQVAGQFGRTAPTPMLWIYAANDSYFAPPIARAMWREFTAAGGRADFAALGPFGEDGHHLFFGAGGSLIWGPLIERYLAERGVTAK